MTKKLVVTVMSVLMLSGCTSSHLALSPDGTIVGTLEVVPGADKPDAKLEELNTALNRACEPGTFQSANNGHANVSPAEFSKFLETLDKIKGFLGKTTVTLSGHCV